MDELYLPPDWAFKNPLEKWESKEVKPKSQPETVKKEPAKDLIDEHPISLLGGLSMILKEEDVKSLRRSIPASLSLKDWKLLYSTTSHGLSINTLYLKTKNCGPSLLLVEDSKGHVFGAFVTDSWRVEKFYYGGGETFLFKLRPSFKKFMWTGENNFFINSRSDCLAVGGGEGKFGLWINEDLTQGSSYPCQTFSNESLGSSEEFEVSFLEIWAFT
eukprot:TRINITY_DN10011_c0_g1_i1.p1 TRINITY_DN10011_c0_g1~~TRINITY_DN10011_c0_g1_i1.p1  ORF type:complete len:228 (-),score=52.68 TRINITY_DN10011_c0_g1_i1:64-711(-)